MPNKHKYDNRASRKYSTRSAFIEQRHKRIKRFFIISIAMIILLSILYVLLLSPLFKIKKTTISFKNGPFLTSKPEILSKIRQQINQKKGFFQQNNIFLLKNKTIKKEFSQDTRINSILIEKDIFPPCEINLIIDESKPVANLSVLGGNDYFISSKGEIIQKNRPSLPPKSPQDTPTNHITTLNNEIDSKESTPKITFNKRNSENIETLPWIYDKTSLNIKSKKASELFNKIINFINSGVFEKNNIAISKINLEEKSGGVIDINIFTQDDWNIKLNSETNFTKQVQNLKLILHNKIKNTNDLEYIDLRFNNRVFYKNKEENKKLKSYD